jgi:hypothetical protein
MNDDATVCRICSAPKEPHLFCCRDCWKSLPREMRVPFITAKARALAWLRNNTQRKCAQSTSTL